MRIVEAWKPKNSGLELVDFTEYKALSHSPNGDITEGYVLLDESDYIHAFYEDYFDAERDLCRLEGGVAIGPDYIAIYDQGEEIAYWQEDEWLQEPKLSINLANAVRMYYTKGPAYIRRLLGK